MQFLHPSFLWLSLLAIIPIALYLFRRKSRTVRVSTLVFFKSLAREHQESAWLRRLKRLLSLLLTLLILLGGVFALARAVFSPPPGEASNVVILFDRSASMAAFDSEGVSRLDAARSAVKARLAALPEAVPVSLVAYDSRAEVIEPKTTNRRAVLRAVDQLAVRPIEDSRDAALAVARRIASLDTPAVIWHATDRSDAGLSAVPDDPSAESDPADSSDDIAAAADAPTPKDDAAVTRELIDVSLPDAVNAGITAFQIRPVPLEHGRFEAYIQVALASSAPEPLEAKLEVSAGGVPVPRLLDLEPGAREGLILPVQGAADQLLEISIAAPGDQFPLDDRVVARLPESRPVVVRWIAKDPDPFTRLALSAIAEEGELDIWQGGPDAWPLEDEPDVIIFDGWLPDAWPKDVPAIVIDPPGSSGPVRAARIAGGGVPHESVRAGNTDHPVLFRVSSGRVAVTQTAILDTTGSLEPLWFARGEPILAAGEVGGQRIVIMAFAPELSEQLPLTASFPLLVGNAVFWCAERSRADAGSSHSKTGQLIEPGGGEMQWREMDPGSGELTDFVQPADGSLAELDRLGLWETADGRRGSALLLSRLETDMAGPPPAPEEGASPGDDVPAPQPAAAASRFQGEITWLILAGILGILILESYLFHRRAVY